MGFFLLHECVVLCGLLDFLAGEMADGGGRSGDVERVAIFLLPLPHESNQSLQVQTFAI